MDKATSDFRKHFAALSASVYGKPLVYFDNAATSHRPDCVIELQRYMSQEACANVHRAVHRMAMDATDLYQKGREAMVLLSGLPSVDRLFF